MAGGAAGAASAAAASSSWATLMDQHASSSGCSCCLCRHSCCGLSEDKARLAAALIAARSSDHTTAVASLVLFAASVGVIFAKLGSSSPKARPPDRRARGQMHSFRRGFSYYHLGQDRRDRYFVKRTRKSRWEWRPVTHRSTGSQTVPLDLAATSSTLSQFPDKFSPSPMPMVVEASSQVPEESTIASLLDFPDLSREVVVDEGVRLESSPPPPRSGENVKDLVAAGLKLAPLPMVELLRTDSSNDLKPSLVAGHPQEQEEEQQNLNRKQRKHLKKKQKKLVAASRTFQIGSLPVLKSWRSSSSPPPPPSRKLVDAATTPCKIYDCANKTFGPLGGSPSSKSIAWTCSLSKPSYSFAASTSTSSLPPQPSSSVGALEAKVVPEISEISESPKSYLGDRTDSESFKRSNSDPEELDVPSLDFEFEEDSEDYNLQPSVPSH